MSTDADPRDAGSTPGGAARTPSGDTLDRRPRHSWEAYSVIVATIVGLLSLAVSAYTAYTLRVQTRAQVYPYLQVEAVPNDRVLAVHNKGVGPAFVTSVAVTVDGAPVLDWPAFFRAIRLKPRAGMSSSTINHAAIAANEKVDVLTFADAADFVSFTSLDHARYRYRICYCSVLEECWSIDSGADTSAGPHEERTCRGTRDTEFKD